MHKPTDYPLDSKITEGSIEQPASDITFAMLKDRMAAEQPVTEEMIRIARTKMDTAHNKPVEIKADESKLTISRIRDRFRPA